MSKYQPTVFMQLLLDYKSDGSYELLGATNEKAMELLPRLSKPLRRLMITRGIEILHRILDQDGIGSTTTKTITMEGAWS